MTLYLHYLILDVDAALIRITTLRKKKFSWNKLEMNGSSIELHSTGYITSNSKIYYSSPIKAVTLFSGAIINEFIRVSPILLQGNNLKKSNCIFNETSPYPGLNLG